ncbi:MAG: tetratricopeptide repeat protein [Planctomycetota bacterium]
MRPGSWLYSDVQGRIEAGFLKSGDYDALADYYQEQLKQRPDDLPLQTRLSTILTSAGRLTEAKEILEASIERAPKDTEARLALINLLISQSSIAEASEQFEELTKNDPDNPDHLIRWGQVLLDDTEVPLEQRRDAAIKVWSRLAESRSDDAVTLSQIADRMRGIQRSDEAIELYKRSIEVDPASPQYREYLGEYLHSLDRKEEAIEAWKQIAGGDRKSRESLVRLAEVFGAFEQDALALETWEEASTYDLNFTEELRYAATLVEAKRYELAFERYALAEDIAESPDEREQLLRDRITAYQASGTLETQIAATEAKPESPETLRTLALLYGAAGDSPRAEQAIQKALAAEPDDPDILLVAADIAETQNRLVAAAELFEKLAAADNRFRSNYLQRVANLNVRIGRIDRAMEICEAIIDANPASPESYQFLARTAFGVQRDEPAIAALRRAMSVAPRDNLPRRMLAGHFADRFRTDEAIELYWQIFRYEAGLENKISVIAALGPLYDRKSDVDALISRIQELTRKEGDSRATTLLIAAAHESIQDYGAARAAIEPLLAAQPRDVALLGSMVRLSDAADEVEAAAEYQQRITDLADTPENRFRLIQYQVEAGEIDISTALSQRISFVSDPSRLGGMVRSSIRRGDLVTAKALCSEAIKSDESLWDLKLILAQMLLSDQTSESFEENRKLAVRYAREVREVGVTMDAKPPSRSAAMRSTQSRNQAVSVNQANPMYWSQSCYQLASLLRVGPYANAYGNTQTFNAVEPQTYGHARVIAASLIMLNAAVGDTREGIVNAIDRVFDEEFAIEDVGSVNDPGALWECQTLVGLRMSMWGIQLFSPRATSVASPFAGEIAELEELAAELTWRLADVDKQNGLMPLMSMLFSRQRASQASANQPGASPAKIKPLSEERLRKLIELSEQNQLHPSPVFASNGMPPGMGQMMLQGVVAHEVGLAGKPELAESLLPKEIPDDASYWTIVSAIQFWLSLNKPERAEALVSRLLPAARNVGTFNTQRASMPMNDGEAQREFNKKHQQTLVDTAIALYVQQQSGARRGSSKLGNGEVRGYVPMSNGARRSVALQGPLSTRLLDSPLVQSLSMSVVTTPVDASTRVPKFELPDSMIASLQQPLEGAGFDEQKTRYVLAAYANWWAGRPEDCYESLVDLCEKYPSDIDLQIERARLASILDQPKLALEALDSFSPLDSKMLVRKEMAAMNLAAELGDIERAKLAAERLFGMRLEVQTQLALVDQLGRLGLKERADAMLQRTRSGRSRDIPTQIRIANAFLASGDQEAASEVAYTLFRRLSTGRSQQRNVASYRQQAVSILKRTDRLAPLIERAERRVESTPKAIRPKLELAELYTAAGRSEDASSLWDSLSDSKRVSTQQLMTRAEVLAGAKKYDQAIDLYLEAFEKEPQRFNNDIYRLTNAVRQAGDAAADKVFKRLLKMPISSLPSYRLSEVARMGSRTNFSEAKRKYIGKVLKSTAAQGEMYNIARSIPESERKKIPEYRNALISAACSADVFLTNSNTWRVSSRSSGGTANGPLADILGILASDEDAERKFRKAAEAALETDGQKASAEFLLALLNIEKSVEIESQIESMKKLIAPGAEREDYPLIIASGLLWQAGQILEKVDEVKPQFLIDLYTEAKRLTASSSKSSRYTVDNRLIKALVAAKQTARARDMLMQMYRDTNNSEQNQYNPGYGDYQDLQSFQWIGEQLITMDGPVEAFTIFKAALGDPDRFERAKRWGGNRNAESSFREAAEKASNKITPDIAAEYLLHQLERWEAGLEFDSIVLMETPIEKLAEEQVPSILAFLLEKACADEKTVPTIQDFEKRLKKLTESNSDAWQVAAVEWLTASHLGSGSDAAATRLFERLPDLESMTDERDGKARVKAAAQYAKLLTLYPVAKRAIESDDKVEQSQGERLVRYLETAAGSLDRPAAGLALATLTGDPSESVQRILDSLKSQIEPGRPASEALVLQCLRFAGEALGADDYQAAAEALKLALGGGPPLRKITTTSDPFAVTPSTSRPDANQDKLATINARLREVLVQLESKTGVPLRTLSETEPNADLQIESVATIVEALTSIAMPENRPGTFFPYAKRIASLEYDPFNSKNRIQVQSVSLALARLAAATDQSESVYATLQSRLNTSAEREQIVAAMLQVAFAAKDASRCRDALKELESALDTKLPSVDEDSPELATLNSISSQDVLESQKKSSVIDTVLQAIWPIIQAYQSADKDSKSTDLQRELASPVTRLLTRTNKLIRSDSYTASRHRIISQYINENLQKWAVLSGDPQAIDRYIENALTPPQGTPNGTDREEYLRGDYERNLMKLLGEGMLGRLDQPMRNVALFVKGKKNYLKRFEPQLCLILHELPREQRLPLLEKITLGRSGKEPIAYLSGLVRYELPPDLVRDQQPSLDAVLKLPTCTDDFPLVNSLLLLIDDAVAANQAESLSKSFAAQIESEGDAADIASALLRIAVAERDETAAETLAAEVLPTIKSVAARLVAKRPNATDKTLAFPELESILAFRAAKAGIPVSELEGIIRDAKTYAIRAQRNRVVSAIAHATAKLGIGRTAGGTTQSPLTHFHVVGHPSRFGVDSQTLPPLFAIDENGWVSGTSGPSATHLMLKFPLTGTFEFSANIRDGSWGESDIAYGGIVYQAQGWDKAAKLAGVGSRGEVVFPVSSIKHNDTNVEAISVTPLDVQGVCNGEAYVQDIATESFPFPSIAHLRFRTTQFKDIRITGEPTIPEQVELIGPNMRGWGILARGRTIPLMLLPIGPKQNREQIESFRQEKAEELAKGPLAGSWSVVEKELHYRQPTSGNAYDPPSQIQYLRPLQDGESITIEYWSEKDAFEFSPSLGRMCLNLTEKGVVPIWIPSSSDLAAFQPLANEAAPKKEVEPIHPEVQPKDKDWNTLVMRRTGDEVAILLNDETLVEVPIQGHERPGIYRTDKNVRVRSIVLRGQNWPKEVPEDLMATP